jgi:hypothetical protein
MSPAHRQGIVDLHKKSDTLVLVGADLPHQCMEPARLTLAIDRLEKNPILFVYPIDKSKALP